VKTWRIPLPSKLSPQAALMLIRDRPWPFALVGRWAGGGAILGCDPIALSGPEDDPLALLDRLPDLRDPRPSDVVGGGWFGWLGYGIGSEIEDLSPPPPRPSPLPSAHLAYYDHLLRRDAAGRWWFEALVTPDRERQLGRRLAQLGRRLSNPSPAPDATGPGPFRPVAPGTRGHIAAVSRCLEMIRAGEIFQANLHLRLAASWCGDLPSLFARASESLRPAYGAAFIAPWGGLVSMSPELFLRRRGSMAETAPIKGTVARTAENGDELAALELLRSSPKDAAEHVMIVDVARNDLGRVCEYGSVEAPSGPDAEAHPGVWHLVSRVGGRLRPTVGDADLIRAAFPAASVTGAPKIRAMRAIAELEATGREAYTGGLGYASPAAGLELSVAIRTFEAWGDRLWLDVGGAVVADSSPRRELEECIAKARPLVAAAGSRIALTPPGPATAPARRKKRRPMPAPPPALSERRERPDPALGVLETILVQDGSPRHLDPHLNRLARSLSRLYGVSPPPNLRRRLIAAAATLGRGALRLRATRDGGIEMATEPVLRRATPVCLRPFTLPGGLGEHKWADRRLLDALAALGPTPLLVDSDGSVLEAAWGNVWIREAGCLLTPPADGRILAGLTRGSMLEDGEKGRPCAREEPIDLERLIDAEAILISASLAGLVPAGLASPNGDADWSSSPGRP
jgi:para-aminobenzoate synthetase/4-amino-4-deoxychorismate lyase